MRYRVQTLPIALEDGNTIYRWIAQGSQAGHNNWYTALLNCIEELHDEPSRFAMVPEQNLGMDVRERLFKTRRGKNYRLIFTIIDNEVKILRIRGPGQAPIKRKDLPKKL